MRSTPFFSAYSAMESSGFPIMTSALSVTPLSLLRFIISPRYFLASALLCSSCLLRIAAASSSVKVAPPATFAAMGKNEGSTTRTNMTFGTPHPLAIDSTCGSTHSANSEPSKGTIIFLYILYLSSRYDCNSSYLIGHVFYHDHLFRSHLSQILATPPLEYCQSQSSFGYPQKIGIEGHNHRTERHEHGAHGRTQQDAMLVEHSGCERDGKGIVPGGPGEVLHHLPVGRPGKIEDGHGIKGIVPHQDDVRRLHRH